MINPIDEVSFFENAWIDMDDVIDESESGIENVKEDDEEYDFNFNKKYAVRFAK